MMLLADACTALGDKRRAGLLYELLAPYRSGNVVIGLAAVCMGSAARYLGRLATTIGDRDRALGPGPEADRLIESAAATAQRLGLRSVAGRAAKWTAT